MIPQHSSRCRMYRTLLNGDHIDVVREGDFVFLGDVHGDIGEEFQEVSAQIFIAGIFKEIQTVL